MSRFASDPDLLASHNSSGTMSLERNENIQKSSTRGIQRLDLVFITMLDL